MSRRAFLYFIDFDSIPDSIAYEFGQMFEVEDIDDFIYTYSDDLEGAEQHPTYDPRTGSENGGIISFVTGQDAELFYTFASIKYTIIPEEDDGGDGGDGGLP